MKPGRPRREPKVRWDLYLRADLAAAVELILADPVLERAKYGERSKLIEELLEQWLQNRIKGAIVAVKPTLSQIELLMESHVKFNIRVDGFTEMPRAWAEKLGLLPEPEKTS